MGNSIQRNIRGFRYRVSLAGLAVLITMNARAQLPDTIDFSQLPGSEGTPVTRIYGEPDSGGLGWGTGQLTLENAYGGGTTYGDFNGDGYADLAIGAPQAERPVNPLNNDAGCVYFLFGGINGLPQEVEVLDFATGPKGARIYGDDTGVQLGQSLATGDFNNDGYDDIVLGAMRYAPKLFPCGNPYPLYILYGSADLPGQTIYLPSETDLLDNGVPDFLSILCTGNSFEYMGTTLATGDFDGDGLADIIAGSNEISGADQNVVIFGATIAKGTQTALAENSGDYTIISGPSWIGFDVGSGDINGDGFDDILLGEGQSTIGTNAWNVYIVLGHNGVWEETLEKNEIPTRILGETLAPPYDGDGRSFAAAGDMDGDGRDDLIITSEADNVRRVTIVYGADIVANSTLELSVSGAAPLTTRYRDFSHVGDNVFVPYHAAVGDMNGDGLADVLVGAAQFDTGTWQSGRGYLIYGDNTNYGATIDLDATGGNVRLISASTGYDHFGTSPGAGGDTNGDGFADMAVAAPAGITAQTSGAGYAVQVYGAGTAMSATATEGFQGGNAPTRGFGGRLSPVVRTHLAFTGGTAAPATATMTRHVNDISNFDDPAMLADVTWELSTTRTGWTSAEVTFHYLDQEIIGLVEDALTLYHAPTPAGPWTEVAIQDLNTHRNEITATLDSFSNFVIAQKGTGMPVGTMGTMAALVGVLALMGAKRARR